MLVGTTVPGFKQALTQMQKGGRYKIVIPGRLAYGKNPPQGTFGILPPTELITQTGQRLSIDGVAQAFADLANPEAHTKIIVEPWR